MRSRTFTAFRGPLLAVLLSAHLLAQGTSAAPTFVADPAWLTLPEGRAHIGSMHGDVAVSAAGDVYISVEGSVTQRFAILGPSPGLQVYSARGTYLRNVPNAPPDLHGFVIARERDGEFIFGARLAAGPSPADQSRASLDQQTILKMTVDGRVVMAIPAARIPDRFKNTTADRRPFVRLTSTAVAPNGDLYVADGYASDYIHRFNREGKYLSSFGGKEAPYAFRTLHKIAIDRRFQPARLIATDRENGRVVHLSLEGAWLGVVADNLLRPAAIAVHGEYAAVAELRGRVTVLDKMGRIVTTVGANGIAEEVNSNRTEPEKWRPGIVTAPHGIAFTTRGDLLVSEFNLFGRVHRFNVGAVPSGGSAPFGRTVRQSACGSTRTALSSIRSCDEPAF